METFLSKVAVPEVGRSSAHSQLNLSVVVAITNAERTLHAGRWCGSCVCMLGVVVMPCLR